MCEERRISFEHMARIRRREETHDHAGHVGGDGDDESNGSAPVDSVAEAVDAARVVELGNVVLLSLHDEEVGGEDGSDGGENDRVGAHEANEGSGGGEDLPGSESPNSDEDGEDLATKDVDPAREEGGEIVGRGDGVSSDVGSNVSESPG